MKTIFSLFTTILMLVSNTGCAQSQNDNKKELMMLREFYTSYITVWADASDLKMLDKKLDILQKEHCTRAFLKQIPDIMEQTEADPILKAQDVNIESLKTLSVTRDSRRGNGYIVSYIANNFDLSLNEIQEKVMIYLTLLKEEGHYKIDSIE